LRGKKKSSSTDAKNWAPCPQMKREKEIAGRGSEKERGAKKKGGKQVKSCHSAAEDQKKKEVQGKGAMLESLPSAHR